MDNTSPGVCDSPVCWSGMQMSIMMIPDANANPSLYVINLMFQGFYIKGFIRSCSAFYAS